MRTYQICRRELALPLGQNQVRLHQLAHPEPLGEAGQKLKAGTGSINFFLESDPDSSYSVLHPLGASISVCFVLFAKPTYIKEAFL
jgi:hypothetical protein